MGLLTGKVAAITGGASGIGEATARRFVREGARVAIADIDADKGNSVVQDITNNGGEAIFLKVRVEDEAEAQGFIDDTVKRFGQIDILINNAGMRLYQNILQSTDASWSAILGVNVKGYAFCAKAAIAAMRKSGGGTIVNIASNRSLAAGGNMVEYDTTKAAVIGLTRGLAYDHAADGIRVNAISPGPVFTPFHEKRAAAIGKTVEEFVGGFGSGGMLKRPARPEELAACILFMASDESSYVTGANLLADGGLHAVDPDSLTSWLQKGFEPKL